MNKDSYFNSNEVLDEDSPSGDKEYEQDIVLLRYMAQRIYITLYLLDEPTNPSKPLLYFLEEGHKYTHRIAIYNPQALLLNNKLDFVGFISRKLQPGDSKVIEEIRTVDKKLIVELINTPGLMSYSSLELRDGRWCNLVLFSGPETKIHLKQSNMHKYAAYQLSPRYYDWVRLHNGIMPDGLAHNELLLQKTKFYQFHGPHEKPKMRELTYEA
jgi:hypothetical protein